MAEIVLFHHAGGQTRGVVAFAVVHDGVACAQSLGEGTFAARMLSLLSDG